jgi:crossover junction endodeoxyribonuclease RusA
MKLDLPYPDKALWPNGRPHHMAKARQVKKHREWAWIAARADLSAFRACDPVPVRITVHGKPRGPLPDKDGVIGAAKSYLDGIADAIRVNDRTFAAPTVEFAADRTGRFVIEVGA